MPHSFDTGATKAQRTRVRQAVIARLAVLRRSANPPRYLTAIKELPRPYRGELDVDGLEMLIQAFNGQAPAIAVALGRKTYDEGGLEATDSIGELVVVVYVASQHQRDHLVDGRLAADVVATADLTKDPGIETMLEHVEERLLGQLIGVEGVKELRPADEDIIAVFKDISIAELRFKVAVERTINPARDIADKVTSVENDLFSADIGPDPDPDNPTGLSPFVTTVANLDPED